MSLDELSDLLKLTSSLMEIIDENPYKINAYKNASFNIDKINFDLNYLNFVVVVFFHETKVNQDICLVR